MKVLVYRKCSTCLKALKWLEVNQVVFDERPIKEENPSYEELKAWYEMSGLPLKKYQWDIVQTNEPEGQAERNV